MSQTSKQGLICSKGLEPDVVRDIEHLAVQCNQHDDLDLKLNYNVLHERPADATNDFLFYEQGILIGYLAMFSFNSQEAEFSGMVHPAHRRFGIFTQLLNAATAECQHRGIPHILLIVEQASTSGQAFVKTLQPDYDHTEYKMTLQEARLPETYSQEIAFRQAGSEDIAALKHITAQAFNIPEHEVDWYADKVMDQSSRSYYLGLVNGQPIGKIDVTLGEHEAFIFGFGVLAQQQGRGYGRQILARTIQAILATGQQHIALEVMVENKHALSLYQSCGFEITTGYDYYRLTL
ncbi:MAG TPA: GNAT family N-acetyltransferase [Ktedonobacteraceae bacterium]|nr:GNAT family N-acetyltransferase [Ktedonobacteraceae bacterium]